MTPRSFASVDSNEVAGRTAAWGAFTLIELLVVVTIIVVLLALLMPAMNKAVYQAELVVCAARQGSAARGAVTYTADHKRYYPHRAGAMNATNWLPMYLSSGQFDDRPAIFSAIRPQLLLDPFSGKIDLQTQALQPIVYANYGLWFGFRYKPNAAPTRERGMYKLGDRFTWTDSAGIQRSYNLLISDQDTIRSNGAHGGHPDRDEPIFEFAIAQDDAAAAVFWGLQGRTLTLSHWRHQQRPQRGLYDTSFALDDGAVLRFNDVTWDEGHPSTAGGRMVRLPEGTLANDESNIGFGRQVPRP